MNNDDSKLVSVEIQREFDAINKGWQEKIFVKLYVAARTSGFLADISDRDWKTLCVLATFMDVNGNCYPSQDEIARSLGISRQSANQRIQSLLRYRWKEKPIIAVCKHRKETTTGKKGERWDNNSYTILPPSNLCFGARGARSIKDEEPVSGDFDIRKSLKNIDKKPVSRKPDTGNNLDFNDKKPKSSYPVTGKADTNKIHNTVVVEGFAQEKNNLNKETYGQTETVSDNSPPELNVVVEKILLKIRAISGAELENGFVFRLLREFPLGTIWDKMDIIEEYCKTNHVDNLPGLILRSLRDDWKKVPVPSSLDRMNRCKPESQPCEKPKINKYDSYKKRELIKTLYFQP